ncbi:MAG: hypothetical protein ACYTGH_05765 [Planctomycetota bacterium]|jgi:hypothetical protein
MSPGNVPETHERIREEDIQETLDLFAAGNDVLPALDSGQHTWLVSALGERKSLCENQFSQDGTVDPGVSARLRELDGYIKSVHPEILSVLHFLSRIRAILPVLRDLQQKLQSGDLDSNMEMVTKMQFDCSQAEVKAAVEGLATLRVRPRILDTL